MLGRRGGSDEDVTCIACGSTVGREKAREYDKYGDRWNRDGKEFEYLCKPCHRELCHQPRRGLEDRLVELDAGGRDRDTFLAEFVAEDAGRADADPSMGDPEE